MTTHRAIVDALFRSAEAGESVVLATVVRITGSSYGGVGTRMVAHVDGSTVGIVSGGCLESDLAEHAKGVHSSGVPRVVTYDTRADDDTAWGLGLGCNGLIEVLLEPLTPSEAGAVVRLLEQGLSSKTASVVATVIGSSGLTGAASVGAHALFSGETVETIGDWGDRQSLEMARRDAGDAVAAGRRGLVQDYNGVSVAFEIVRPAVSLVICGVGPDVLPLVEIARQLGWYLTVVDHRLIVPEHEARFPGARLVECAEPSKLAECVPLEEPTAAVVMSHHFERDTEYVRALLKSPVAYIGVLGPRARGERMLAAIGEGSGDTRVYSPIGMDIGGDGPEAIALSVVAEISAVLDQRNGGHLKDRQAALHA